MEKNFPQTFLGKSGIERWQSCWKQLCQKSENIYKKHLPLKHYISSQSTSGHISCFFGGPAEQNRTNFWKWFAQCPKNESRNFCETKVFSQKNLPDTISYILKTLPTFFAKTPKNSRSEARIFLQLSHSLW